MRRTPLVLAIVLGCNPYTAELLGGGGAGGDPSSGAGPSTGAGTSTGAGGEGGEPVACESPADCPGEDTECGTRTCDGGTCGVDAAPQGTPAAMQMPGDCLEQVCDGAGIIVGQIDDSDAPDDGNACTDDLCRGGIEAHPILVGEPCSMPAGGVCNADGACVECIADSGCASLICTDRFTCAPASCGDGVDNGQETDVDCGGSLCPGCPVGDGCMVGADCLGGSCVGGTCAATCTDGLLNQGESDVDCGGPCADCTFGQDCNAGTDCDTGTCTGGTCSCAANDGVLLISELRTRGPAGGSDDFVELYNPGSVAVTLTSSWTIESRSTTSAGYTVRFTGSGQSVGPGRHFLVGGSAYVGPPTKDASLTTGITDEASVLVRNGGAVVDAVCFSCSGTFSTHTCEGTKFTKMGCTNDVDASIERKPGGNLGNCIDTDDNSVDFAAIAPSLPQNLASPAVP
jgi:hypothetical protein